MRKGITDAAAWLHKRWLSLSLAAMVIASLLVAAPKVHRLTQYAADQAASLRKSIAELSPHDLSSKERLPLEKDLLQYETDTPIKIWTAVVQALGGAALIIGLFFTWENLRITQETAEKNRKIAQDGQITERFTGAIEQLGSDKPHVRLGGIHALARIAKDSERDHWPIMEVLTAFVRAKTPAGDEAGRTDREPASDIQAILTIIGRRKWTHREEEEEECITLWGTDLRNTDFWRAYLGRALLYDAKLAGAYFPEATLNKASFERSDLVGANFERASLEGANCRGANLTEANLREANLVDADFRDATLTQADLSEAILDGADFSKADLRGALHLSERQLAAVRSLHETKLDADLKDRIAKERPDLFKSAGN